MGNGFIINKNMSGRENTIKLHQTLHGYAEGHRLLESSIKLPPIAARAALILSDMSGPSMFPGFENYVTGYPLQDTNMYALSRTWYAPEMSRPGCVWTHTLLIDNADIAQILDLNQLLKLFIRPAKDKRWSSYNLPLEVHLESVEHSIPKDFHDLDNVALQILKGLYGGADKPVYLQAENSKRYEDLLILVWSQQWPRLRRSFRFCTGSLSNRKTDGKPFDLQVIPRSLFNQIQREANSGIIIQTMSNTVPISFKEEGELDILAPWLDAATLDLTSEHRSSVRKFLWRFGADLVEGREVFAPLVQTYICISEVQSGKTTLGELLKLVSNLFPSTRQALRLKQALFGGPSNSKIQLLPWISEADILRVLVTSEHYSAFSPSSLLIRERAKALLDSDHEAAIELTLHIITGDITPRGEEFLTGVCESVSIEDALYLAQKKPGLLPLIIQYNPTLIMEPSLWKRSSDVQRELFDTVMQQTNVGEAFLHDVIPVLLAGGSDSLAEDIVRHIGDQAAVVAILEWFDSESRKDFHVLGERWQRILSRNKDKVLEWLQQKVDHVPRITTMALIARMLDPHAYQTINAGALIWAPLAKNDSDELEYDSLVAAMSFLLALGFHNPPPTGVELVTQAFDVIHTAAENNQLNYTNWGLLQNQAPSMSFWRSWDWCERLRCALIESFIRFKWPYEQFLIATARPKTFARVLDCCDMTSQGRKFFRKIKQQVAKGNVQVTDQQRHLLEKYK